jgi:hypothetical protein
VCSAIRQRSAPSTRWLVRRGRHASPAIRSRSSVAGHSGPACVAESVEPRGRVAPRGRLAPASCQARIRRTLSMQQGESDSPCWDSRIIPASLAGRGFLPSLPGRRGVRVRRLHCSHPASRGGRAHQEQYDSILGRPPRHRSRRGAKRWRADRRYEEQRGAGKRGPRARPCLAGFQRFQRDPRHEGRGGRGRRGARPGSRARHMAVTVRPYLPSGW